jgi:CO/xanthine dehydrogenase Mo-binding subunit
VALGGCHTGAAIFNAVYALTDRRVRTLPVVRAPVVTT